MTTHSAFVMDPVGYVERDDVVAVQDEEPGTSEPDCDDEGIPHISDVSSDGGW